MGKKESILSCVDGGEGVVVVLTDDFNLEEFIGEEGWSIWKGPLQGDGLEGEEDRDQANDQLSMVDIAKVVVDDCILPGEHMITGEEKLLRLKAVPGRILLDARVAAILWNDYQESGDDSILEWLYCERQVSYVDFFGEILRSPDKDRQVFCLDRDSRGWELYKFPIKDDWQARNGSACLDKR